MCGIAGAVGAKLAKDRIYAIIQSLKHRGPDADGYFQDDYVTLIHTRLSILDVSENGAQPMLSSDGRYAIVFNGEVYNHLELRRMYLSESEFKSESDTETILQLFILLGENVVPLLRGMFAFVIYDTLTKKVFGARDRMGIKPFLYANINGVFVFGSELKAIKEMAVITSTIEPKALRHLFLYGSIQFPYSLSKNVLSIPPAHFFYFTKGELDLKCYWKFPAEINRNLKFEQAKEIFSSIYEESIRLQLLSDRKVGVFLSSGIDSVSILPVLKKLNKTEIETFTIGFTEKHNRFTSEIEQAKILASHFGFKNISKAISSTQMREDVDFFMKYIDQPSIDGFNTHLVSKESHSVLTVALSGLGGDELMLGYPRNVNLYNKAKSLTKLSRSVSDKLLINELYKPANSKNILRLLKYIGNPGNIKLHYWFGQILNRPWTVNNQFFCKDLSLTLEEELHDFYQFDTQMYKGDLFNTISYYEMRSYMMSQLLRDMDVASMANGIEVRYPMIDHKLVEFVFSLPATFKYLPKVKRKNNQTGKMSYSQSGSKYLLACSYQNTWPKGFLDTKKQGFQLPINDWFYGCIKENLGDRLSDKTLEVIGFEKSFLTNLKDSLQRGEFTSNHYLMNILLATI